MSYGKNNQIFQRKLLERVDPGLWDSISINGRFYGIPKEKPNGTVSYVRSRKTKSS